MAFANISRLSLEILNQNFRAPGVGSRAVPAGRGDAASPQDANFRVADEFMRVVPIMDAYIYGRPMARQYQVRTATDLVEPNFTARAGGTAWVPGMTSPFGQELELSGARFKKISTVVRSDELMVAVPEDVLAAELRLARVAVVRALSEAIFHSNPATDDNAELAGLPFYLGAANPQDVTYTSTAKMIGGLSEIEARCHPGDDGLGTGPDVFVMSSRARWRLLKELEDKGITPDMAYSPLTDSVQLHFHGVPVLMGRVAEPSPTAPAAAVTEAWALTLFGESGVRVYTVGGDKFGIREEPFTTMTSVNAAGETDHAARGVEVYGVYSLLVPDPCSIARLRGIPTPDPFTVP